MCWFESSLRRQNVNMGGYTVKETGETVNLIPLGTSGSVTLAAHQERLPAQSYIYEYNLNNTIISRFKPRFIVGFFGGLRVEPQLE